MIKNCYNAGSAEGQLEVNPVFWLATWAGKMDFLTQGDCLIEVKIVVLIQEDCLIQVWLYWHLSYSWQLQQDPTTVLTVNVNFFQKGTTLQMFESFLHNTIQLKFTCLILTQPPKNKTKKITWITLQNMLLH